MNGRLRMAAVAAPFGRDLEADFALVERLIGAARADGVGLLALPEACLGGYLTDLGGGADGGADGGGAGSPDGGTDGPPALDPDGPGIGRWVGLAGGRVVCAGYCEDAGRVRYNSGVCVSGDGVLGRHRKVHQPLGEGASYAAGDRFEAFDTPVGRLGMMICYDKAFPEAARSLALDGAGIVVCMSAWPASRTATSTDRDADRWTRRCGRVENGRGEDKTVLQCSAAPR